MIFTYSYIVQKAINLIKYMYACTIIVGVSLFNKVPDHMTCKYHVKELLKRFMFAEIKEPLVLIMIRVIYKNFIVIICSSPQFYSSHPLTQVTQLGFIAGHVYYFREQNYGKQHACNKKLTSSFCSNIHLISTCTLSHSAVTFI